MAQRTITISERAVKALDDLKREGEGVSDVILRLAKKADLVRPVESTEFYEELVDKIEEVYNDRREYTRKKVSGDKEGYIKALKQSAGILKMDKNSNRNCLANHKIPQIPTRKQYYGSGLRTLLALLSTTNPKILC